MTITSLDKYDKEHFFKKKKIKLKKIWSGESYITSTLDIQACVSDHMQKVQLYKGEEIVPLGVQEIL